MLRLARALLLAGVLLRAGHSAATQQAEIAVRELVHACELHPALSSVVERQPEASVPPLIRMLMSEDWFVRGRASHVLETIGTPAMPALVEALADPDPVMRARAAWILHRLGSTTAVEWILAETDDPAPVVRRESLGLLAGAGPTERVVAAFTRALDDIDDEVRHLAILILSRWDERGRLALTTTFEGRDEPTRRRIAVALLPDAEHMRMGPGNTPEYDARRALCPRLAPILVAALGDADGLMRQQAARGLGECGDPATLSALAETLATDSEAGVRRSAATGLAQLTLVSRGRSASQKEALRREVARALARALLGDEDAGVRTAAARALERSVAWVDDADAASSLALALKDPDRDVARAAAHSLAAFRTHGGPAVALLVEDFLGSDRAKAHEASRSLARVGEPAVPPVSAILSDTRQERLLRHSAAFVLGEICSPSAASALARHLDEDDLVLRAFLAGDLLDCGGWEEALPVLVRTSACADVTARQVALQALCGLSPAGQVASQGGLGLCLGSESYLRERAAEGLLALEDDAQLAVPALEELARTGDRAVRSWASDVLADIAAQHLKR